MKNSEFYNDLSSSYDDMINFEKSLNNKIELYKNFIKPEYKTALDLGCGTGADSIALSKNGLVVDAVDHSSEMLKKAGENTLKHGSNINFIYSNLENFLLNKNFDLIVSLGNTIANIQLKSLYALISNLAYMLAQNGTIVFQIINYNVLPKSGEYILNEFRNEDVQIIRKYQIYQDHLDFIITKHDRKNNSQKEIVTKIYHHSLTDFQDISEKLDLKIDVFGNLMKAPYIENESKNLVVQFTK